MHKISLAICGLILAGTALICGFVTETYAQVTPPSPPAGRVLVPLDVSTVTTGGTAVTALTAGHRTGGGWISNPSTTTSLCINEVGTASGTTSSGNTTCILPGQSYNLAPNLGAVSVVASDSAHVFSGYGFQ